MKIILFTRKPSIKSFINTVSIF